MKSSKRKNREPINKVEREKKTKTKTKKTTITNKTITNNLVKLEKLITDTFTNTSGYTTHEYELHVIWQAQAMVPVEHWPIHLILAVLNKSPSMINHMSTDSSFIEYVAQYYPGIAAINMDAKPYEHDKVVYIDSLDSESSENRMMSVNLIDSDELSEECSCNLYSSLEPPSLSDAKSSKRYGNHSRIVNYIMTNGFACSSGTEDF